MSEQAFTPPPWTINDIDEGESIRVSGKDGVAVASVYNFFDFPCLDESEHSSTHAEAVANAYLIAAAPKLVATLEGVLASLRMAAARDRAWVPVIEDVEAALRLAKEGS
jgi:hypothetical protein